MSQDHEPPAGAPEAGAARRAAAAEPGDGLAAYADIPYLTPDNARFTAAPGGFLCLEHRGDTYERVAVHRAFPFSHGDDHLSVRDSKGNEIAMVASLDPFPDRMQDLLRQELDRRYFMPRITRIDAIKEEFGYTYWTVETDRGPRTVTVRGLDESVFGLDETRLLIVDVDGSRFIIDGIPELDAASRRRLELFL